MSQTVHLTIDRKENRNNSCKSSNKKVAINSVVFRLRSFSYKNSFAWLTNDSTKFNPCFLRLCARFRLMWFIYKNAQLRFSSIYSNNVIFCRKTIYGYIIRFLGCYVITSFVGNLFVAYSFLTKVKIIYLNTLYYLAKSAGF